MITTNNAQKRGVSIAGDLIGSAVATGDNSIAVAITLSVDGRSLKLRAQRILHQLPRLPDRYQERPAEFDAIRASLVDPNVGALGITGAATTGLLGMGGIGKTVLAAALVHDPSVQAAFPAGVAWLTFGRETTTRIKLDQLVFAMSGLYQPSREIQEARSFVGHLVEQLHAPLLVVLDDVWTIEETRAAFAGFGPNLRLLVTTRDRRVLDALGAKDCEIGLLTTDEALEFLATSADCSRAELPVESGEVIRRCSHLPLALAAVGALIRRRVYRWPDVVDALKAARQSEFPTPWLGDSAKTDLAAVLRVSIEALSGTAQRCLYDFAVLREDTAVPEEALAGLWSTLARNRGPARAIAIELADRSVLQRDADRHYTIHDLYRDFLADTAGPLSDLHCGIVERYGALCDRAWARGPDDGYFFECLPWHLTKGDQLAETGKLLLDPAWLQAKLTAAGIGEVVADYRLIPDEPEFGQIAAALRLSVSALADPGTAIHIQLCGRLAEANGPRIERLLAAARASSPKHSLIPSVNGFLDCPGQLIRILRGHDGFINDIAVARDGRTAASASEDSTVILWNTDTGGIIHRSDVRMAGWNAVAIMEGASRIVAGADDGAFNIWTLNDFALVASLQCPDGPVDLLVELPDGWRAVTASSKGGLQLWDVPAAQLLGRFGKSDAAITSMTVGSNGHVLVGDATGCVRLWDPIACKLLQSFEGLESPVRATLLLSDGSIAFAGADDGTAIAWTVGHGARVLVLKDLPIDGKAVALLPSRGLVVSGAYDGRLHLWNIGDGHEATVIQAHGDTVSAVAPLPDDTHLLTGSFDGTLRLWDPWSPPAREPTFACGSGIYSLAITSDSCCAVSGSEDGKVRLWDLASGKVEKELPGHDGIVHAVALLSDDQHLVSGGRDGTIGVWDLQLSSEIRRFSAGVGLVHKMVFIDDDRIVVAGGDGSIELWTPRGERLVKSSERHSTSISALTMLPDCTLAASGSNDGTIRIWDLSTGRAISTFKGHADTIHALAVQASGRELLSGSANGEVKVWDLETNVLKRTLAGSRLERIRSQGGKSSPAVLAISGRPESKEVMLCCGDNRLSLWDAEADTEICGFTDDHLMTAIALDGRGTRLIAGNQIGRLHTFELPLPR